jgi:hypothetical protein
MKVQENIKKCVAFVALQMADGTIRLVGTVFFIVRDKQKHNYSYAVTAKHVIEGIKNKGLEKVFLRMNLKDGQVGLFATNISDWIYHNDVNVDIALHPIGLNANFDHLLYPESEFVTEEFIKENEIDVGDEVIITGLFKHHHGTNRNLPIVRIGNISAMLVEKIQTKETLMDGYLIEARSIGGLSGSPVFTNLGIVRKIGGEIKHRQGDDFHNLIGLIYGHYDSHVSQIDEVNTDWNDNERVNTGIAIVTPITKLIDLFNQTKVRELEIRFAEIIEK